MSLIGEGVVERLRQPQEEDLEAAKDTAINLPELLRRQSVQHFQAPPQEISTERKSDHYFDKLNDQFSSAHRCLAHCRHALGTDRIVSNPHFSQR